MGRAIQVSDVKFGEGLEGFQALAADTRKGPAVILLHERYGLVQHSKDLAIKLAGDGYTTIAPDLYSRWMGNKKALNDGTVQAPLKDPAVLSDLVQCVRYLKTVPVVEPNKIAVVGVCMTGRHALLLAAHCKDVAASVVIYGAAGSKDWVVNEYSTEFMGDLIAQISSPLLGIFGEKDHVISIDDVLKFRKFLEDHRKGYQIHVLPDAPHGWLNDTMPGRYRPEARKLAWELLMRFLDKVFTTPPDPGRIEWRFENNFARDYDFSTNVRLE